MTDADDLEYARRVARLLRGLYEDSVIEDLEGSLPLADSAGLPMPGTVHPAYASNAPAVRELMSGRDHVRVPRPWRPAFVSDEGAASPTSIEPLRALTLTVRKCVGPAPFVGDPRLKVAVYVWRVAVDDAGRHVAGDAELVWSRRM